ncbi:YihY/virulence factor BrkB family protein [Ferruginibacter yonginensis]|uniref:YihY/virulence factor BrkB family protein n=1 Tax=Ferruginibacter yonginensis TaxID=1310416 RepID=A0ABV8QPC3_9BACT
MTKFQRIILSYTPIPFLIRKSKNWYPPGFEGLALYDVLQFFRNQVKRQGLTERASAIAYNFIMAIPPSLLFIFTLIPNLPFISKRTIKVQLHSLIRDIIPSPDYNKQVMVFVDSFIDGNKIGLLSFGLLLTLFFSSNGMMGIMRSFNKNYVGFEQRKGLQKRGVALRLTILIFGLLLAYLLLLIMQGALLKMVVQSTTARAVITYIRWGLIIVLVYLIIGVIFKYAPAVQKRWRFSSPGTILATTLSLFSSLVFSIFVSNFARYNALYGSIGTIMMVMALIFINSLALLIGFELNVSIHSLKVMAAERATVKNES